ncbi:hypothetical protein E3P92_02099 [Wallemia ichthyophaga]|uniref:Oxidoreductase-like domain-containing protein n=1 Tax=Wallemia ichthyophaga TaxID=245174 RepID=A0A4T0EDM9_WALIC|nr:hypothetical protein E3P91_02096 [Wallemia ichthyophaga]TIA91016.1 hypothetical protein E3P97_02209 [Wallemia ichthyophaga]TIB00031.1 hypothetical protein E3P95_01834 [Wallemia ichthyophaga]TIB01287.1 hypothetical protein E3P94_01866 [Wallemia ichthyophaga]TIB12389.1 hypothetical protein E3P90_02063 [Wallemia ichthyophaga]
MRSIRHFCSTHTTPRSGRSLNSLWSKLQRENYESISTEPATTSIQTPTPNPGDLGHDKKEKSVESSKTHAHTIQGVEIPTKPNQPAPDECCMSGCPNCTYDIYADDLANYLAVAPKAASQLESKGVALDRWPMDLRGFAGSDSSKSPLEAEAEAEKTADKLVSDLDPTMRAFLEMERNLKKKKKQIDQYDQIKYHLTDALELRYYAAFLHKP